MIVRKTTQTPRQDPVQGPDAAQDIREETPGQRISRRRLSRAEYTAKKKARFAVKLLLAFMPFTLVLAGLVLISVGFFHYVEQESVLSLLLEARSKTVTDLRGIGWNQATPTPTPQPMPLPTDVGQLPAIEKSAGDRLITPFFYIGDTFGTLRIPRVGVEAKAFQGDSEAEFRKGIGHYTGSYLPGQDGNILLSGHRTMFLRNIEYLNTGDLVYFDTTYGSFMYRVRTITIMDSKDALSIASPTDREQLTIYTCYPFVYLGNADRRFVVICDLIAKEVRI